MKFSLRILSACVLGTGLLSGCGGGVAIGLEFSDDDHDHEEFVDDRPFPSGRPAAVDVSAASDPALVGTYSSSDLDVSHMFGILGNGNTPDTCVFTFAGLQQAGQARALSGEIRYLPGDTTTVRTTFIVIDRQEFRLDGSAAATIDRTTNAIRYDAATLFSTQGSNQTITLTGAIPMRDEGKPTGC